MAVAATRRPAPQPATDRPTPTAPSRLTEVASGPLSHVLLS